MFKFKSFNLAIKALKAHKARTFLSVLGVVIGISAVIVVMSTGEGLKSFILGQIEIFGSDTIEVEIKVPNTKHTSSENATGIVSGITITTFKNKDVEQLRKIRNIDAIYGGQMGQDLVSYKNTIKKTLLFATEADFTKVDPGNIEIGRYFTEQEDKSLKQVAVLGSKVKEKLFGDENPIGENIKIGKLKFKVIGAQESKGSVAFFDMDDQVFIPLRTYQKKLAGVDHITFAFAKVKDTDKTEDTVEEMRLAMRDLHGTKDLDSDDFAVISMAEGMEMMDVIIRGIIILLTSLVAISLVVGGIGIMNIMYVSVIERTFEIGLRKAVGAKKKNIKRQFLWEAIIITLIGGIIGIIIGITLSYIISYIAASKGFEQSLTIPIGSILIAFGFSASVGLFFGYYPAKKASELDPIQALLHE
jgi:ABC-type antimicrobial peptide transport system permease subunit